MARYVFVFILGIFSHVATAEKSFNFQLNTLMGMNSAKNYLGLSAEAGVAHSEHNSFFKMVINDSYAILLKTPFGQQLVQKVLKCSPSALEKHLGVSLHLAIRLVNELCENPLIEKHTWIHTLADRDSDKIISLRQKDSRSYEIQFLADPQENRLIDSWTDFKTQTTTIFFSETTQTSDFRARMLFILAHETAIYFDQKSHLNKTLWSEHPELKQLLIDSRDSSINKDLEGFFTASNNPVISQVLAYIRAFRVEEKWLKQIDQDLLRQLGIDFSNQFESDKYIFLKPTCTNLCLRNYINLTSKSISYLALPLLVNSHYWSSKLLQLSIHPPTEESEQVRKVLTHFRNNYVTSSSDQSTLPKFDVISATEVATSMQKTAKIFEEILIPEDLQTLFSLYFLKPPALRINSLDLLTQPSLGNFGTEMASGPRPRIRTGSSSQMNLKKYITLLDLPNDILLGNRDMTPWSDRILTPRVIDFFSLNPYRPPPEDPLNSTAATLPVGTDDDPKR